MAACKGCNNRLGLPVGTSGHCNPCYLATRIERVVLTRYPPAKAEELTHYLAKVLNTLEADSEAFEADKTSGVVDQQGYLLAEKKDAKARTSQQLAAGVHPGEQHPQAASARVKKEKQEATEAGTPGSSSRHRRRRREDKERSKSRSRRRDRRKAKKEPTPEPEQEVATEPEAEQEEAEIEAEVESEENEEVSEEPSQHDDDVSPDTEVARDPQVRDLGKFHQSHQPESHYRGGRALHRDRHQDIVDDNRSLQRSGRVSSTSFGGKPWDTAARGDRPREKVKENGTEDEEASAGRGARSHETRCRSTCRSSRRRWSPGRGSPALGSKRRRSGDRRGGALLRRSVSLHRTHPRRHEGRCWPPPGHSASWHRSRTRTSVDMGDRCHDFRSRSFVPRRMPEGSRRARSPTLQRPPHHQVSRGASQSPLARRVVRGAPQGRGRTGRVEEQNGCSRGSKPWGSSSGGGDRREREKGKGGQREKEGKEKEEEEAKEKSHAAVKERRVKERQVKEKKEGGGEKPWQLIQFNEQFIHRGVQGGPTGGAVPGIGNGPPHSRPEETATPSSTHGPTISPQEGREQIGVVGRRGGLGPA